MNIFIIEITVGVDEEKVNVNVKLLLKYLFEFRRIHFYIGF